MKKLSLLGIAVLSALLMVSCGSSKQMTTTETKTEKATSLEGAEVVKETSKDQGIEMVDDLSEDGLSIRKVAYKWYAGRYSANDKATAIEMAQREAYATISRVLNNMVLDEAERGTLANNTDVQKAAKSHWQQVSLSIQKACEPFGETVVEYNPSTRVYTATAKVGVRGDRYNKMLNEAGSFKPDNLKGEELQQFMDVNKNILEAAKVK